MHVQPKSSPSEVLRCIQYLKYFMKACPLAELLPVLLARLAMGSSLGHELCAAVALGLRQLLCRLNFPDAVLCCLLHLLSSAQLVSITREAAASEVGYLLLSRSQHFLWQLPPHIRGAAWEGLQNRAVRESDTVSVGRLVEACTHATMSPSPPSKPPPLTPTTLPRPRGGPLHHQFPRLTGGFSQWLVKVEALPCAGDKAALQVALA